MVSKEIIKGLTRGLTAGYGGKTESAKITRGSFPMRTSILAEDGFEYHDEWLRASTGGGQELLEVGEERFTRLYAGGTANPGQLAKLGLNEGMVIDQLKSHIVELGDRTRLFQDCHPPLKNDWQYDYNVIETDPDIPVTMAKETITYKGQVVFVHDFLLCPITG